MNRLFTKRCEQTSLNRCADKSALKCFRKQKSLLLIIMVIGFAVFNSKSAAAEVWGAFIQSTPTYFSYNEKAYLSNVFYLSDQEIWYDCPQSNMKGELICIDINRGIVDKLSYELLRMKGEDANIECIQHIGDRLMIGYRDFETNYAEVVIFNEMHKEVTRVNVAEYSNKKIVPLLSKPMVPTQQGILFAGNQYEEADDTSQFYMTEIDAGGKRVFESLETKLHDSECYSTNSIICSDEEYHYILSQNRTAPTQPVQERLICKDIKGETVWEARLPDTLCIKDIAAFDGNLYLAGLTGEKDDYGNLLVDQKGILLCFDKNGNKRWEQVHSEVTNYFLQAIPNAEGCYALANDYSMDEKQIYVVAVRIDGAIDRAGYIEPSVTASLYSCFFISEDGKLAEAGKEVVGEMDGFRIGALYMSIIE